MLIIELEITGVNQIIKSIYVPLVTMPFSNFFDPSIFFLKQLSFTIIIVTSVTRVQSGTIAATVCHKQKTQICKREKFGLRCLNKKRVIYRLLQHWWSIAKKLVGSQDRRHCGRLLTNSRENLTTRDNWIIHNYTGQMEHAQVCGHGKRGYWNFNFHM